MLRGWKKRRSLWLAAVLAGLAMQAGAVELTMFVNEPQGGRCAKNINDAAAILAKVSNVRVSIVPRYLSGPGDPDAPAVVIDSEVVAENKGLHNGRLDREDLLAALIKHGAVPYEEGYRVINSAQLKREIDAKRPDLMIIDARNPEEYQEVHIPSAVNIPEKKFAENSQLLPKDKKMQLVFYCNGVRCGKSKRAAKKAKDLGYTNILVYAEGMPVWEEMNYPIYAGPDHDKKIETSKLSPAGLQKLIDSKAGNFVIVDVRDEQEFSEGHIPGAINMPVDRFAVESGKLDKDMQIIVYCNSGGRSYLAYRKLMKLDYKNIKQSLFADWKEAGKAVEKI